MGIFTGELEYDSPEWLSDVGDFIGGLFGFGGDGTSGGGSLLDLPALWDAIENVIGDFSISAGVDPEALKEQVQGAIDQQQQQQQGLSGILGGPGGLPFGWAMLGATSGLFGDRAQRFMLGQDPYWDMYSPDPTTFGLAQQGYQGELAALGDINHPLNQQTLRQASSQMSPYHTGQNQRLTAMAADQIGQRRLGAYQQGYDLSRPIVSRTEADPGFLAQVAPHIGSYYAGQDTGQSPNSTVPSWATAVEDWLRDYFSSNPTTNPATGQ